MRLLSSAFQNEGKYPKRYTCKGEISRRTFIGKKRPKRPKLSC